MQTRLAWSNTKKEPDWTNNIKESFLTSLSISSAVDVSFIVFLVSPPIPASRQDNAITVSNQVGTVLQGVQTVQIRTAYDGLVILLDADRSQRYIPVFAAASQSW